MIYDVYTQNNIQSPTTPTTPTTASPTSSGSTPSTPSPTSSSGSSGGSGEYIEVRNYKDTQDYYLTFILDNIDSSSCGESIDDVQIYYATADTWRSYDQYFLETTQDDHNNGHRYAFQYAPNNIMFSNMLDISIVMLLPFIL